MASKTKNIIIFVAVGVVLIILYLIFFGGKQEESPLLSSEGMPQSAKNSPQIAGDFLNLLLSVKNIKLEDTILNDATFRNLIDSSIVLIPEGNEGRSNPFAPIGTDF